MTRISLPWAALIVFVFACGYAEASVSVGTNPPAANLQISVLYPANGILTPGEPQVVQIGVTVQPSPGTRLHTYQLLLRVRGQNGRTRLTAYFHPTQVYSVAKFSLKKLVPDEYDLIVELDHDGRVVAASRPYTLLKDPRPAKPTPIVVATATATATNTATATPTATRTVTATATATHTATATATARPTTTVTATPTPNTKATPTTTPTPGSAPTPVALKNPQNPVSYGADASGGNDSTSAFQNAIDVGDLDIQAGVYKILGSVAVPDGRNIRCESGAALVNQTSSSSWTMFQFNGNTSGSVFNCQFRGVNYNLNAQPAPQLNFEEFINIQSIGNAGTTGNILISGNDFNGIGGFVGAVMIYGNDSNQPPPHNVRIAYNTFEHCGYYAVQLTSGTNNLIDHNTLNDCAGFVEADDTGQQNTDNLLDSNHLTFTYGIGMDYPNCNPGCGSNTLTGGSSASGSYFDYSGNTVSNNIVDGTHPSTINIYGNCTPAQYLNNTCSGGCTIN